MNKNDKIFIIGHKKPDTDSVTSAINLSYLKNRLGYDTIPMVLGDINNETKFVLNHFNVKIPQYLNDVKLQIKDLDYEKNIYINQDNSLFEAFNYMNNNGISNVPVVDNKISFKGDISMKDIAKDMICENLDYLEASFKNIVDTIRGKEILKFSDIIKGNVIVASYRSTTFIENIKIDNNTILVVGDRHSIIEYAINNNAKLIILTGGSNIKKEHLENAIKNKVSVIRTNLNTFNAAKLILLAKYVKELMITKNIICFNENEEVNDFINIANRTKYSNFPIVDKNNHCLGFIKISDTIEKNKKRVILVDHNEYEQSVDGLEEAEIVEIIDHHKIGSIGTSAPINFRNMPVGSTNTIIYMLYKENNIEIPTYVAGLMISGIISDTLLFSSPTTTNTDIEVVKTLAKQINIDYEKYAMEMFKAGSVLKGKTKEQIIYSDFKDFTVENNKIGISQVSTINSDTILSNKDNYIKLLNEISKNNDYDIICLFVTDILKNGSYIFFNNKAYEVLERSFKQNLKQGDFLEKIISRKKQIIPNIMEHL